MRNLPYHFVLILGFGVVMEGNAFADFSRGTVQYHTLVGRWGVEVYLTPRAGHESDAWPLIFGPLGPHRPA